MCRHQALADELLVEPCFDEDGIHHGEARRREGDPRDLRLLQSPAESSVGKRARDEERGEEGHQADREARAPFTPELRNVDLCPGEECQDDSRERSDEGQPVRNPPDGTRCR